MSQLSPVKQEAKWQREDDARTLARAEEIRADKKRSAGAVKEAGVMAKRADREAAAIRKVAGKKKAVKKAVKKSPAKKK